MKKLILTLAMALSSTTAVASLSDLHDYGYITCEINRTFTNKKAEPRELELILEQTGTATYQLTVWQTYQDNDPTPLFTSHVKVTEAEDVIVVMKNKKDKVTFGMYMDELDQSYLYLKSKQLHFTCELE